MDNEGVAVSDGDTVGVIDGVIDDESIGRTFDRLSDAVSDGLETGDSSVDDSNTLGETEALADMNGGVALAVVISDGTAGWVAVNGDTLGETDAMEVGLVENSGEI